MYLFANPGLTDMCGDDNMMDDGVCENVGSSRLFSGGDQYGRFMACLHRVIENNLEKFLLLGINQAIWVCIQLGREHQALPALAVPCPHQW